MRTKYIEAFDSSAVDSLTGIFINFGTGYGQVDMVALNIGCIFGLRIRIRGAQGLRGTHFDDRMNKSRR